MCNNTHFCVSQNLNDGSNYGAYVETFEINALIFTNSIICISTTRGNWDNLYITIFRRS